MGLFHTCLPWSTFFEIFDFRIYCFGMHIINRISNPLDLNPSVLESKNQSFSNILIRNKFELNKCEKLRSWQNK